MSDDEKKENPIDETGSNPLTTTGSRRRKPFTQMMNVDGLSDQFMWETFEMGADLSGDEKQIAPSNPHARVEEVPADHSQQSGAGLGALFGGAPSEEEQAEEEQNPQVTTFSSLMQETGEFKIPKKVAKAVQEESAEPQSPASVFKPGPAPQAPAPPAAFQPGGMPPALSGAQPPAPPVPSAPEALASAQPPQDQGGAAPGQGPASGKPRQGNVPHRVTAQGAVPPQAQAGSPAASHAPSPAQPGPEASGQPAPARSPSGQPQAAPKPQGVLGGKPEQSAAPKQSNLDISQLYSSSEIPSLPSQLRGSQSQSPFEPSVSPGETPSSPFAPSSPAPQAPAPSSPFTQPAPSSPFAQPAPSSPFAQPEPSSPFAPLPPSSPFAPPESSAEPPSSPFTPAGSTGSELEQAPASFPQTPAPVRQEAPMPPPLASVPLMQVPDLDNEKEDSLEHEIEPSAYTNENTSRHRAARRADFTRPRIPQFPESARHAPHDHEMKRTKRNFFQKLKNFFRQIVDAFGSLFKD